jgi:hypothetical protein
MIRNDDRTSDFEHGVTTARLRVAAHGRALALATADTIAAVPANARWIGAGFVAGILFWHTVGFWTFMNRVVFESPHVAASDRLTPSDIETGSLRPIDKRTIVGGSINAGIDPACTALLRGRDGVTQPMPCRRLSQPLKHKSTRGRGDLQVAKKLAPPPTPVATDWTAVLDPIADAKLQLP